MLINDDEKNNEPQVESMPVLLPKKTLLMIPFCKISGVVQHWILIKTIGLFCSTEFIQDDIL